MHLIIAEKNIAANRIAQILSGKDKVSAKKGGWGECIHLWRQDINRTSWPCG